MTVVCFFFKQKAAYEMRISDWSSDVGSSDLPFGQFMAAQPRGTKVSGTVKEVDAKGAVIELADGVEGYVAARDIAEERVEDASQRLKVGDTIEAKFTGMDRKGRSLQLSIKAKDDTEPAETLAEERKASSASAAPRGTTHKRKSHG